MIRRIFGLLVVALLLPLASCDDGQGVGSPGILSLYLTDEAGDFTQAIVTIERIELVGGDEDARVLRDEPFTTDLLTLSNDVAGLVEEETIPAGTYSQLRFVIPEACIGVEQEDGSEAIYASPGFEDCGAADGELQMPSFGASGLKVGLPGGSIEVDGDTRILLLDFDVSQSFGRQAGGSGRWVMDPVIKADDISLSGTITVELTVADSVDLSTVGSSLADFEAELSTETEAIAFTDDDDDGVFMASFLFLMPAEDIQVSVALIDGVSYAFTLDPASPQSVTLGSAEQATVSFEVTSAAPNP